MRKLLAIIFTVSLFLLNSSSVLASESSFLTCDDINCNPDIISPFFADKILWQPGTSYSSIITIKNTSENNRYIGHKAQKTLFSEAQEADIASVMELKVTRMSVNKLVFKSKLSDFYNSQGNSLGLLGDGKTDSFKYEITMLDAGNEYQGKKTQFDLVFGFFFPTPTPTPSSTPTPTNTPQPTSTLTPAPTLVAMLYPATYSTPAPAQILESFFSNPISNTNTNNLSFQTEESGQVEGAGVGTPTNSFFRNSGYVMVPQNDPYDEPLLNDKTQSGSSYQDTPAQSFLFNYEALVWISDFAFNFLESLILFIAQMLK